MKVYRQEYGLSIRMRHNLRWIPWFSMTNINRLNLNHDHAILHNKLGTYFVIIDKRSYSLIKVIEYCMNAEVNNLGYLSIDNSYKIAARAHITHFNSNEFSIQSPLSIIKECDQLKPITEFLIEVSNTKWIKYLDHYRNFNLYDDYNLKLCDLEFSK